MGRESDCVFTGREGSVAARALLESTELVLRGGVRRRISFVAMAGVRGEGDRLSFMEGGEAIALRFPTEIAAAWAKKISSPPPSLAAKMGIGAGTRVFVWGSEVSEEVREAVAVGLEAGWAECELVVAQIATPRELADLLQRIVSRGKKTVPFWIVYPKGKGHAVNEGMVREQARETGFMDVKVASVATKLTGLRFTLRIAR